MRESHWYTTDRTCDPENHAHAASVIRQVNGRWANSIYETVAFVPTEDDARRIAETINAGANVEEVLAGEPAGSVSFPVSLIEE